MPLPDPEPGLVIPYDYLWKREADGGQETGRKTRPAVVVLKVEARRGGDVVWVAPVTHSPPSQLQDAIEIPHAAKAALNLDGEKAWIVCTEVNEFLWPGFDVRPVPNRKAVFAYGFIPPGLFRSVRDRIAANAARARLTRVGRD